jgi:hypothetical protein
MLSYDLCVAWNWEHDADFVALLDTVCRSKALSLLQITPGNLADMLHALAERQIGFRAFFDRASDVDTQFMPLVQRVHDDCIYFINSHERASRTWDKAVLHSLLITAGLDVPQTIILPAYAEQPDLSSIDLVSIGEQFTIKPAHGGGGVGVMTNITSWDQVLSARQEHATDQYLLQSHVVPKELALRPAWFRVIYCAGQVFPCWWNPSNHIYTPVTDEEKNSHGLDPLYDIAVAIARLCGLDLFSTEIALTSDGLFVVVDYVNDQIDLRLQSKAVEGVPDDIVRAVAERLVNHVVNYC